MNLQEKLIKNISLILLPIMIFLLWYYISSSGKVSAVILPSIENVLISFWEQLRSGQLFRDIGISLFRVLTGFFIAAVIAIGLGIFMALSLKGNYFFSLTFDAIRQIPTLAWIPLLILWFGIGESSKVLMIIKAAFFPILLNTLSGIQSTPKSFIELGKLHHLNFWGMLKKIYIPHALPSIFVGLNLALGMSWATVVGAELIAADSGIGYRINDARIMMLPEVIIVGMITIGIVGVLMTKILKKIEKIFLPWLAIK